MHSQSVAEKRRTKLDQLAEIEGFDNPQQMIEASIVDSVCPAICLNDGCDYTVEMEPDQDRGWCELCDEDTVASALILADRI